MNNQSVLLNISSKEGIFQVNKSITLFHEHVSVKEVKGILQAVKKEITKLGKTCEVMLDVDSMTPSYSRTSEYRYIFRNWWAGKFILDVRKFNGYDFSDSKEYTFADMSNLLKYLMKRIHQNIEDIMDTIPEEKSRYQQELDEKYPVTSEA